MKYKKILSMALCSLLFSGSSYAQFAEIFKGMSQAYSEIARQELLKQQILEVERERIRIQEEAAVRRLEQVEVQRKKQEQEEKRVERIDAQNQRKVGVTGSGFFVTNDGYVITNAHVIGDYPDVYVKNNLGKESRAKIVAIDTALDFAILRTELRASGLKIKSTEQNLKGENVFAIGYPVPKLQGQESKITSGLISSLTGLNNEPNWMQISAPIQGGNSGGPLLTEKAEVVGVVVATVNSESFTRRYGSMPQNINFAIKSKLLLEFMSRSGVENKVTTWKGRPLQVADQNTVMIIARDENPPLLPEQIADNKNQAARLATEILAKTRSAASEANVELAIKSANEILQIANKAIELDGRQADVYYYRGFVYDKILKDTSYKKLAAEDYTKSAELGNHYAQAELGHFYLMGIYYEQNYTVSRFWLEKAKQGRVGNAIANLAWIYQNGFDVEKNPVIALSYFTEAAYLGHIESQSRVAQFYYHGTAGEIRYDLARSWAEKAAENNLPAALNLLGVLHETGNGFQVRSIEKAKDYYRRSALLGSETAKTNLARLGVALQ